MLPETLGKFAGVFAEVKARWEEGGTHRGLVCRSGLHMESAVLKLQKASWTNDSMKGIQNESGVFFSVWINEEPAQPGRANYNIHALKLRKLKGYSIASRDFAEEFRGRFAASQVAWPNVSLKYGPLTLMQGWIGLSTETLGEDVLSLMRRFEELSPVIDGMLDARRR